MKTASWVLREKDSGYIIAETWDRSVVERLNTAKYEAIPIMKYLMEINRAAFAQGKDQKHAA